MDSSKRKLKILAAISLSFLGLILLLIGLAINFQTENFLIPTSSLRSIETSQSTPSAALGIEGQEVLVVDVIDGDTIEIEGGDRVRYIGIDTPETVDPRRPVGCFGKEASLENKMLVEGKMIILVKDVSEVDKFGRLLRYIYVKGEDGQTIFVNDYLIREGFAKASTFPPDVRYSEEFLQAEREARGASKGLWGKCS